MSSLKKTLLKKGYIQIPFKISKTNHLILKVELNGKKGRFILDTGASNSCIGFEDVDYFGVETAESEIKAAGGGAVNMETLQTKNNRLKIGNWKSNQADFVIFDMSHVNQALQIHNAKPIKGIIGANILQEGKAVLDYDKKCFYLKEVKGFRYKKSKF